MSNNESNVVRLRDHSVGRLCSNVINQLSKNLDALEELDRRLVGDGNVRASSTAILHLVGCLVELEKLSIAHERCMIPQN